MINKILLKILFKEIIIAVLIIISSTFIVFYISSYSAGETEHGFLEKYWEEIGAQESIIFQYILWFKGACIGDFGNSINDGYPVIEKIKLSFLNSALLIGGSFLLCLIFSFFLSLLHFMDGNVVLGIIKSVLHPFVYIVSMAPLFLLYPCASIKYREWCAY